MKIGRRRPLGPWRHERSTRGCSVRTDVHIIPGRTRSGRPSPRYVWDPKKEEVNRRKHGLWFGDVVAVFEDEMALTVEDPDAMGERRFIATGRDYRGRVVTVVYTPRGETLRLISARRASSRERAAYRGEL